MPIDRVLLLGFMASGKTTVGARLAERLGWTHLDFDREIERGQGRSIAEIFAIGGESHFRALEAEVTPDLLQLPRTVLSTGGGWVTNPALFELLPPGTLSVWLRASPEQVLRRLRADPSAAERPLLRVEDPSAAVRRLLRQREPLYGRAAMTVDTDRRGPDEIAKELETIVRGGSESPQ